MKSFLQVGVPVIVLMMAVGVVAFMTQNTARTQLPSIEDSKEQTTDGDVITFDDDLVVLDSKPMDVEYPSTPHKDYYFHTNQERDVLVGLWYKSCGCADVKLGSFGLNQNDYEAIAASPTPAGLCELMDTVSFADMPEVKKNETATIPATKPGRKARPFVMRIFWTVKKTPAEAQQAERLKVELNATLKDGAAPQRFAREIQYVIVPAHGFWPATVAMGEITPGGAGSRDCLIWSPTRDHLNISARVVSGANSKADEPCAEISEPIKLTEEELADLPKTMGKEMEKIRPKCAYKFRVTLHERRGDNQLEMGPLTRRLMIQFTTAPGEQSLNLIRSTVGAVVRGEVSVLNGDEVGSVKLGTFKFDRPRIVDVRLGSSDPKLELEKDFVSNEKLHVTLGEPKNVEGRREWNLHVELEANALIGEVNEQVMLRVTNKPGRRLRIPITGSAERDK